MSDLEHIRVILDADHGIDDSMATLYLASQPTIEIVAVGTVHGNAYSDQAAQNALQVLDTVGLGDVAVAIGAAEPLAQDVDIASMVHGLDGLGGVARDCGRRPIAESAAQQLVRLARAEPGEFVLLATGPLTNIALALRIEPKLPSLLRRVVVMGGAVGIPGNAGTHAEANIWHDPEAAELVFATFPDVTLVPLDVTLSTWVGSAGLTAIEEAPSNPANDLLRGMLVKYEEFNRGVSGRPGFPLHDPLAAMLVVNPLLAEYIEAPISVELRGEHTRGMLVVDRRPGTAFDAGANLVRIAMSVDRDAAIAEFLKGVLR
jgi:purine nucleosidase